MSPPQPALGWWSRVWCHPVLRLGLVTGISLTGVAAAWLLVANAVPSLERFAVLRNLAAAVLAGLLMLAPVCRFLKSPARIFLSGVIAWTFLSVAYRAIEIPFSHLATRLGAFHLFMLGAVIYGLLAVIDWVAQLVLMARHQPLVATRRRPARDS
jgi:hypothetical protein